MNSFAPKEVESFPFKVEVFQAEGNLLSRFHHPNIMPLLGVAEDEQRYCLVLPLLTHGNMLERFSDLNWNQCLNVMRGIASAIQALQNQPNPIIHNDIKLENIMLDQDYNAILTDFGTAGISGEVLGGTVGYTDPEFYMNGYQSIENDVFSLGVLILQLIMLKRSPISEDRTERISMWASRQKNEVGHAVNEKHTRDGCRKRVAKNITNLGLSCTGSVEDRPSITQVIATLDAIGAVFIPCMPCVRFT